MTVVEQINIKKKVTKQYKSSVFVHLLLMMMLLRKGGQMSQVLTSYSQFNLDESVEAAAETMLKKMQPQRDAPCES